MSAILKFDFQKRKQLRFSEVNYINYKKKKKKKKKKKDPILHVTTTFPLKQGKTRTNSVPIAHALSVQRLLSFTYVGFNRAFNPEGVATTPS